MLKKKFEFIQLISKAELINILCIQGKSIQAKLNLIFKYISMANLRKYSDCDSSQEEDQVNTNYFNHFRKTNAYKSADKIPQLSTANNKLDIEHEEQFEMKPKLVTQNKSNKILDNNSAVSKASKERDINRRPLTAAYTFKLKSPKIKIKRNDPVSLFQQMNQAWKKDKFLTSRGNNKEGRKLELEKRNKQINKC